MKQFMGAFEDIISVENLLEAWKEFIRGKRGKRDVQEFSLRLMDNILELHRELSTGAYRHGGYYAFRISDPKPRQIHKASVRDRLVHHAIYRILYPFFDTLFIADSFSCRIGKGTHRALNRFRFFFRKVSRNNMRTCWVLKCDIRKFFESIDHTVLLFLLRRHIPDERILSLLQSIIQSFHAEQTSKGLPLGNLTSQLLVNIYMNEFDQFVKQRLKVRYYIRYADDFVLFSEDRGWLLEQIEPIKRFLSDELRLTLHPHKMSITTVASGVDFLGWVHFPDHRILRTTTKRRMMNRIRTHPTRETINSYFGLLRYGNARKLRDKILKVYWMASA